MIGFSDLTILVIDHGHVVVHHFWLLALVAIAIWRA